MPVLPTRVRPDPKNVAEVLVIVNSLKGSTRREFYASKCLRDLLEIKRIHCKVIDCNKDVRAALGNDEMAEGAIQLLGGESKLKYVDDRLVSPQVFIDGQAVGGAESVQELLDAGKLMRMARRKMCVGCRVKRLPEDTQCKNCGAVFKEILPAVQTIEEHLAQTTWDYEMFCDPEDEMLGDEVVRSCSLSTAARRHSNPNADWKFAKTEQLHDALDEADVKEQEDTAPGSGEDEHNHEKEHEDEKDQKNDTHFVCAQLQGLVQFYAPTLLRWRFAFSVHHLRFLFSLSLCGVVMRLLFPDRKSVV